MSVRQVVHAYERMQAYTCIHMVTHTQINPWLSVLTVRPDCITHHLCCIVQTMNDRWFVCDWMLCNGSRHVYHTSPQSWNSRERSSPGRNRFGSIRFGSVIYDNSSDRFGSVRKFSCSRFDAVRPAFFGRVVVRSGSVRFVSASGSSPFQNLTVRLGSVRPVRLGFLFLPVSWDIITTTTTTTTIIITTIIITIITIIPPCFSR